MRNTNKKNNNTYISDYAVLIKKMRLLRRLNRQQAALLFDFSFKNIERLENGRGSISVEKFKDFQSKYGFSDQEVEDLRSGHLEAPTDANIIRKTSDKDGKRLGRRFYRKHISRECKVLKELRLQIGIDQYTASKKCGFGINTIGWIENGRVELTDKKILNIVLTYGFSMEYFNGLLKINPLKHEMVEQCTDIISSMDENKLRAIMPMLQSMAN